MLSSFFNRRHKPTRRPASRPAGHGTRLSYFALEQRIAFDAAIAATAVDAAHNPAAPDHAGTVNNAPATVDNIQSLSAAVAAVQSAVAPAVDTGSQGGVLQQFATSGGHVVGFE